MDREYIEKILQLAQDIENNPTRYRDSLGDKALAIAFFESSTRTRTGFSLAMQKLGGQVVEISEPKYEKSMSSPESLEDTLRVVGDYVDALALRHYSEDFIRQLSPPSRLINCGNGNDEHPTQALIDLYTIWKEYGGVENISVAIVGDLRNMRTAHSFVLALSKFDYVMVRLISPLALRLPERYKMSWNTLQKLTLSETTSFDLSNEDVIYMTGFAPRSEIPEEERLQYQLNEEKARQLKDKAIILCPLPRIDEITRGVDGNHRAKYFKQSKWGLYVRMAVLYSLLKGLT